MRTLSRRTLLRGLVGTSAVAVALPTFEAMLNSHGTAYAQNVPFPKRFGVWFFGNGAQYDRWIVRPAAGGPQPPTVTDRWWEQLAAPSALEQLNIVGLRERLSIVTATRVHVNTGSVHNEGRCAVMTGSFDRAIGQFGAPTLPSMDQVLAAEFGAQTRFRSLEVGVSDTAPNEFQRRTHGETSTQGSGVFLPMEKDPLALYERLFGLSPEPAGIREAKVRSVVSAVSGDACRLRAKLGRADQLRLQSHLDGLADLERRITQVSTCVAPARPASSFERIMGADNVAREQLVPRNRAICKLLAYALSCDLTRTFSFEFTPYQAATIFPTSTVDSHTLTHSEGVVMSGSLGNVPGAQYVDANVRFTLDQFRVLLEELDAVHDAPGSSVLDSSVVMTATDVNQGAYHGLWDMPLIVAGKAGGALQTGKVFRYPDEPYGRATLTCMQAVGSRAQRFGTGGLMVDRPFPEMLT